MGRVKILFLLFITVGCILFAGCGKNSNVIKDNGDEDAAIMQDFGKEEVDQPQETDAMFAQQEDTYSDIDVDLTELSSTMVYAEVYNMMLTPDAYVGKTIKIRGQYYAQYWEETDKYYHYVIISDATECCQSGIEFIWDDNSHVYPDEYPKGDSEIQIEGVFNFYEEAGEKYYCLNADAIQEVNE